MAGAPMLWRITVRVPAAAVAEVEDLLQPICMAVSSFSDGDDVDSGPWRVEGFTAAVPDPAALADRLAPTRGGAAPKLEIAVLPPRDWVAENLKDFPPRRVGRYYVHGAHVPGPAPPGLVPIRLDAGAAFGTGEHASTEGCLRALDRLARRRRFRRPLDLGCGSGILAIAMAKTWRVPVVASDIDGRAVAVAAANAGRNGVGALVRTARGPGYRPTPVRKGAPYDLIAANVLARPLARLAGDLARHLSPGGIAVLGGFLERDGPRVVARHRQAGLRLVRAYAIDGWQTLVMAR